jgi:replication-associated recombination protein RarA
MINCIDKYAPKNINDVVFNNAYNEHSLKMIFQGLRCKHLLLSGTNGNGKSTIARLVAEELTKHCPTLLITDSLEFIMGQKDMEGLFMRAHTMAMISGARNGDRVVIVLNELDQFSGSLARLWTAMDNLENELLVIITTNHPMKFENAVRSRCKKYNFTRIKPNEFLVRAQFILMSEGVTLPNADVLHYLKTMTVSMSDVRDYLSVLDELIFMSHHNLPMPPIPSAVVAPLKPVTPMLMLVK